MAIATLAELQTFVRDNITNTNSTTYPDAQLNASLNSYVDLFTTEIINSMDEWDFSADYATTSLVSGQQEYIFPTDIMKIKRVEITFDGATWKECKPQDINERNVANDSESISQNYTTYAPRYDLMDNSVFIYPIPSANVNAGLKIWYEKLPAILASATDEPNILRPFRKGLCYGASKDYFEKYIEKGANAKKAQLAELNMEKYILRMNAHYRKRNQDREYNMEVEFVDYGYNDR